MATANAGASRRNYAAMKDPRLQEVALELARGGDARTRCINAGFDPVADLTKVNQLLHDRGLPQVGLIAAEDLPQESAVPSMVGVHKAAALKKGADPKTSIPEHWVSEPKLDGWWLQAYVDAGGTAWLWNRTELVTERLPHIAESMMDLLPPESRVVGELVPRDGRQGSRHVHQLMRRTTKDPTAEGTRELMYVLFDLLELDGEDWMSAPFSFRRERLEDLPEGDGHYAIIDQYQNVHPTIAYEGAIARGLEGVIAKDPDHLYQPGARGKGQIKLKANDTVDVVAMDFVEGKGEFSGMLGALVVGQHNDFGLLERRGTVSSGLDFDTRRKIWAATDEWFGAVMELRHMGVDAGGFRHPVFVRWRDDLKSSDIDRHDGR